MVVGESHKRLTEYSLNLLQKINRSMFYEAKEIIVNASPEPDNFKDLEFVDVESLSWSGGRDDPHVKTNADNDDVPHYESYGFVFAAFNHYIDIRKGPGIFDDYDGYSYKNGSASKNEYQDAWDAKDDWRVEFLGRVTGHRKVDDGIAYWFNDEYVHGPGMKWYRGCSPSIERYSFPGDKKVFPTVEAETAARFPLADSTGKSGKGIPYSVFLPIDNLARYWYTIFLYANPGKLNVPILIAPVLHAIQDAIVPHHAAGCNGNWHGRWEDDFNKNLKTLLAENSFENDVKQLYNRWLQNKTAAPTLLKPSDWQITPSIAWRIDQLVTWLALNAYHEYDNTYNHFKKGYNVNLDCFRRMAKLSIAMALLIYEKAIQDTVARAVLPLTGNSESLGQNVFRASNYPFHYLSTESNSGKIIETKTPQQKQAALFRMTFGLAEGTGISFESVTKPKHFLRHSNFIIRLDPYQDTELYKKDASFRPRSGFASKMCLSFESVNYPNHYIRHKNFNLVLELIPTSGNPVDLALFMSDSTFMPIIK